MTVSKRAKEKKENLKRSTGYASININIYLGESFRHSP
jgi:hypothetical protein